MRAFFNHLEKACREKGETPQMEGICVLSLAAPGNVTLVERKKPRC